MRNVTVFQSVAASAGDRGFELGRAFSENILRNWNFYSKLFASAGANRHEVEEWGREALENIGALAPELALEIEGMASGARVPSQQIAALNARTEILAKLGEQLPECSTVVHTPFDSGYPVTTQTWDWHEDMRDGWLVWVIEHPDGRIVRTVTEYGIVGKIGVNSTGLGLHFNILNHRSDAAAGHFAQWLPVHVLARLVLDRCSTLSEATHLAMSTPVAASSALTVVDYGDRGSRAATIEVSPDGAGILEAGDDGYLVHTNHFIAPNLSPGEALGTKDPDTYNRLSLLASRAGEHSNPDRDALLQALTLHLGDGAGLCCHVDPTARFGQRWETLATVALDVARGHLRVHAGGPCTATRDGWTEV